MKSLRKKGQIMQFDPEKYRDERLAILETVVGHINTNLQKIDQRFEKMEQRFEKIDQQFEKMEQCFDNKLNKLETTMLSGFNETKIGFNEINKRMWSNFLWLLGLILATSGGLFTLMAHGFHWF